VSIRLSMPITTGEAMQRIELALDVAANYGQVDGDHHKAWVIDEMVRALTGHSYQQWVALYEAPVVDEDSGDRYHEEWDVGIAP
jgi:hypothetical protein